MAIREETDKFITIPNGKKSSLDAAGCFSRWWNEKLSSQKLISRAIKSFYFHFLIIFLVVLDTALVVTEILLDSFNIHYQCKRQGHRSLIRFEKINEEHTELAMEVAHYLSIGILVFFVVELIVRIFASGKGFWNIRRRKMEYFDAFIVITSLAIDLTFLHGEERLVGKDKVLVLVFRLWRLVRIISTTLQQEQKHKDRLNQQYLSAIRRSVELLVHKTNYAEMNANKQDLSSLFEYFRSIDQQCQSSLKTLSQNRELTASAVVQQFLDEIDGLENENYDAGCLKKSLSKASHDV
ncbi:unnamed protein product [Adineta ricciae]|uniref:Voltage-gated hydrogen channel 1 n=1 Tax=Adineta ricciae TaxID=249248 RepID=A0A815ZH09_ADIRI|nr:unnamed protein product [Adineta ricciae]